MARGRLLLVALIAVFVLIATGCGESLGGSAVSPPAAFRGDEALARAFRDQASGVEVQGQGTVTRLLPDDTEGDRHQRFILRLSSGQTILVAHNIDVAPRLDGLQVGDEVAFSGEYEWNARGGVVHWTHHDPSGEHRGGWLRSGGRTVQ
jgi:hypothetical protein